jgi:hypothetical protein
MRENNWVSSSTITDFAREVLLESVPADHVGQAIDVLTEKSEDPLVSLESHTFECMAPAYPGWYWAVTVVSIFGQSEKTVSEINLLPGSSALVPQAWKPWAERVQAGDLEAGDILPTDANDKRLTAGFTALDDLEIESKQLHPNQWELGLSREQILSTEGLELAVDRWYSGDKGPRSAMAKAAPASCSTCGFLAPIGGSIGQVFGICANEFGAADGQIVAMSFGCGAHSSIRADDKVPVPVVGLVVDDVSDELEDGSNLSDYEISNDAESDRDQYDHNLDADLAQEDLEENFHEAAIIDAIEAFESN